MISHLYGAKDEEALDQAIHTSLLLAAIGSVLLTVLGFLLADVLLRAVNTQPEYTDGARLYMRIFFLGISFLIFYNMGTGILYSPHKPFPDCGYGLLSDNMGDVISSDAYIYSLWQGFCSKKMLR